MPYACPVCGYPELTEPPHSEEGGGSYEICPSCGFEFGFDDDARGISYETWRKEWVRRGMPWSSPGETCPRGWSPEDQLREAGLNLEGNP
jgi:hypothetical protein